QRIDDWHIQYARELSSGEISAAEGKIATCLAEFGVMCRDEKRAACGALAGEGPLRPAQHFDVGEVEKRFVLKITGDRWRTIEVNDDPRRQVDVDLAAADAADVEDVG